ncbi:hypothetical protein MSPP1_000800 [Malassezia sp. CBS 17886]|nr:hypothetical protein MSPP1_000800 [Malassezia sp. CBS 17886]
MSHATETERPDLHTQRYDRQLRLWNRSGQAALEHANVLVVGASALTGQILKCLVLPGLGAFTVWDDALVSRAEVGANFFLDAAASVGKPYARELARMVAELNGSTKHRAEVQPPHALLERPDTYFATFSLIVCVRQPRTVEEALCELGWRSEPPIPVFCVRSSGFHGVVSVCMREMGIVETHPDSVVDLRLTRPFPELDAFARSFDLHTDDAMARGHIPYVVVLLRALHDWRREHGALSDGAARRAFLDFLRARRPADADDENFDEALAAVVPHVWRPLQSPAVPSDVAALMDDVKSAAPCGDTGAFWLLVGALGAFVREHGVLPLGGALPDMKTTSQTYVALQQVYAEKARSDRARFEAILDGVLADAGVVRGDVGIDEDALRSFIRHAAHLKLVRGRRLAQQRVDPDVGAMTAAFAEPINPVTVQYYLAFLAAATFFEKHHRYPGQIARDPCEVAPHAEADGGPGGVAHGEGEGAAHAGGNALHEGDSAASARLGALHTDTDACSSEAPHVKVHAAAVLRDALRADTDALNTLAHSYAAEVGLALSDADCVKLQHACEELVRGAHSDTAGTAALLGGVVSQEAIKVLTMQYLPLDNTCIYDGIAQALGSIRL